MRLPSQFFPLYLAAISILLPSILAVFSDEAYVTDYHHALLGLPQQHTTFFHRPRKDDKASLLYTLSDQNVLGAVNPGTGALVWRQLLSPSSNGSLSSSNRVQGFLRAAEGEGSVISALGGIIKSWDSLSGREKWGNDFPGLARDVEVLETVKDEATKDVLALFEHEGKGILRRLSGITGNVLWEFSIDAGDLPWQVSTDVKNVYVVGLHGSRGGYNLKVTTVDPVTGKRTDEHTLNSKGDIHSPEDVLFVGANMAAPIIAWTDKAMKTLKVNILGSKQIHSLSLSAGNEEVAKVVVHAPHVVQSVPHFLVHCQSATSHWAEVYHVDIAAGTIGEAYHLPKLPGKGAFSTSSQDANVYFTRNTDDEVILISSASHAVLGRWPLKAEAGSGSAIHGVSEVVSRAENTYSVRTAIVNTADNWSMIRNGVPAWNRVEGLAGAVAAAWADIPEAEDLAKTLEAEAHSNPISAYIHRVERHINDLQYLPGYLQQLPSRLIQSLLPGDSSTSSDGPLVRDNFGFRKIAIVATEHGRVYAIDAGNQGNVLWSTRAFDIPISEKWDVKGIYVDPHRNTVLIRGSEGEYTNLRIVDGASVETFRKGLLPTVESSALVETPLGKWLMPIGSDGFPGKLPSDWAPKETIVVRGRKGEVRGIKFAVKGDEAVPVTHWTFTPAKGQRIVSVTTRPAHDPVASIGRALGDRTVLYKYLNPNIVLITTVSDELSSAYFYLIDSVSGDVLYTTTHEQIDTNQPIPAVISENWFVYSVWGEASPDKSSAKAYQLVVSDLYESNIPNDRGSLGSSANYSSVEPSEDVLDAPAFPYVQSQAFLIPEPISHMTVSQTRQGITSRQLLCTLPLSKGIIGIPRHLLDPRRPVGRKPTQGEAEEGLMEYQPVIVFDPQMVISHQREVIGVKQVITSPALLESTSLVFAYGIDIFGTRITPSLAFDVLGKGFNKLSLLATVLALAAGVGFIAPMVRRKQIDGRWKPS